MTSALDLPEVRAYLTPYLTLHDLCSCARVCRSWNQSFIRWIWDTVCIISTENNASSTFFICLPRPTLDRHSDSIRKLILGKTSDKDQKNPAFFLRDLYCPHLKHLDVHWNDNHPDHLRFLQRHSQTITHLNVDLFALPGSIVQEAQKSKEFWEAAASCPSLDSLSVSRAFVTDQSWPACWKLWSRLRCLRLCTVIFRRMPGESNLDISDPSSSDKGFLTLLLENCDPSMPTRIKELELNEIDRDEIDRDGFGLLTEDQLAILKFCPDLETFTWDDGTFELGESRSPGEHLLVQARHCPRLGSLIILGDFGPEEKGILPFLEARTHIPLKVLELPHPSFGERSWRLLQRHHALSISSLALDHTQWIDGKMVQEMLCELPNLRSLRAPSMQDLDIVRDPRPWVCLGLEDLVIGFEFIDLSSSSDTQRMVFERLSTLRSLKHFKLKELEHGPHPRAGLGFRLENGLDNLRAWNKLETLDLLYASLDMTEDEIQWICEHWPRLRTLTGKLHPDSAINKCWRERLKSGGLLETKTPGKVIGIC